MNVARPPQLTRARGGSEPQGWHHIRVFDRDEGDLVTQVVEVDTAAGWLLRFVTDAKGRLIRDHRGRPTLERRTGRFVIFALYDEK